jgi:hypothetical protein
MPFNTFTVACSTTPTVIGTFIAHYTTPKRKRNHHPAKRQLSYHEGVNLIRQFLSPAPSQFEFADRQFTQAITVSKISRLSLRATSLPRNGSI